jgi:hypothetical protein
MNDLEFEKKAYKEAVERARRVMLSSPVSYVREKAELQNHLNKLLGINPREVN